MANIKVDPDVLDQKAKTIREYKNQHDDAITKLNALVDGLEGEWVGVSKTNYVNAYNDFKGTFSNFSQRMEELALSLEKKASEYRVADSQG